MSSDITNNIEIALKVTGATRAQIEPILTAFTDLNKIVNASVESINKVQEALKKIKAPAALKNTIAELEKLSKIKPVNLTSISEGFEKLSGIKGKIPDLSKFITEVDKLSKLKLPGLDSLANGLKKIIETPLSGFAAKITTVETGLKRLANINLEQVAAVLNKIASTKLTAAIKEVNDLTKSMEESGTVAVKTGNHYKSFGDNLKTVLQFRIISGIILAFNDAMRSGVTAIIDYDQALKNLQAITGASDLSVSQMGSTILDVASKTKFSASEVADGMVIIAQAGFSASEATQTMQSIANLATGTLSSMSTTVDLVTTALRVFEIDASRSSEVSDVFANAVNRSKLTIDKLRIAMNYVGPIAKESGVSFQELSAAMGTLANSGIRASSIGTGLRSVFAALANPTEKLADAAKEAGISLNELSPDSVGLQTAIKNLGLVLTDSGVAFDLFGKRGATAALALTSNADSYSMMLKTIERQGTAAEQAAKQMEGLGVSFKNFSDKVGILAIAFGKAGLATVLKGFVDVARVAVDLLTGAINTAFGNFVVIVGGVTAAVYLAITALIGFQTALKAMAIAKAAAAAYALEAGLVSASGAATFLSASLAPITLVVAAISAAGYLLFKILEDGAAKASKEASTVADGYGKLASTMDNYYLKIVNLAEGSDELKQANLNLRTQLLEVAKGSTEVADEARLAAASIDAFTGEITKGSKDIDNYNQALQNLKTNALVESINKANESLMYQTRLAARVILGFGDAWNKLFMSKTQKEEFENAEKSAAKLAKAIHDGTISVTEIQKAIANFDSSNMNEQQEDIVKSFTLLENASYKYIENLRATGEINLSDNIDDFTFLAEKAGFTGLQLELMQDQFLKLQESAGAFTNIMDKWEQDSDPEFLTKLIDGYKELGGVVDEASIQEIASLEKVRQERVKSWQDWKTERDIAVQTGNDTAEFWKEHYRKYMELIAQTNQDKKVLSENELAQNLILYQQETDALEKHLNELRVKWKGHAEKLGFEIAKAEAESSAKIQAIINNSASSVDLKALTQKYKDELNIRESDHAKFINSIVQQEIDGQISMEQAAIQKEAANLNFYETSMKNSEKLLAQSSKENDPKEYEKQLKIKEDATKKYYDELSKSAQTNAKMERELQQSNLKIIENEQKTAFSTSLSAQKELMKSSNELLKAAYEQDKKTIQKFYDDKKKLAEQDNEQQVTLWTNRKTQIEEEYTLRINASNSEKEQAELRSERDIALKEIEDKLNSIELERVTTLENLASAEYKAEQAAKARNKAIIKQFETTLKTLEKGNTTSLADQQKLETEALKKQLAEQLQALKDNDASIFTMGEARRLSNQIFRNLEIKQEQELTDQKLEVEKEFYENSKKNLEDSIASKLLIAVKEAEIAGKSSEDIAKMKLDAEVNLQEDLLNLALEYRDAVEEGTPTYIERNKEALEAEKNLNTAKLKSHEEYTEIKEKMTKSLFDIEQKEATASYTALDIKQKEAAKTFLTALQSKYDNGLITIKAYYEARRNTVSYYSADERRAIEKEIEDLKVSYAKRIAMASSSIEKGELEAELNLKLIKLGTELVEVNENQARSYIEIADAEDKAIKANKVEEILNTYKEGNVKRAADLKATLEEMATYEANDVRDIYDYSQAKLIVLLQANRDRIKYAKETAEKLKEIEASPEQLAAATKAIKEAEEARNTLRIKYLEEFTEAKKTATEKNIELDKKELDENLKYEQKKFDNKDSFTEKKLTLETAYQDKVKDINEKTNKALKDLDDELLENKKDLAASLADITVSGEDKIRAIKQKSMTDEQKNADDTLAAVKKLSDGKALIAQADLENDTDKLARGVTLIEQYESLISGSASEAKAIAGVKTAMEELKNAENVKTRIADQEILNEKIKITEKNTQDLSEVKIDYEGKAQDAIESFNKIQQKENETHLNAMENNAKERIANNEKLIESLKGLELLDPTGLHDIEIAGIQKTNKALEDKINIIETNKKAQLESIQTVNDANEAANKSTIESFSGLKESADEIWVSIDKNGIKTFSDVASAGAKLLEDSFTPIEDSASESFTFVKQASDKVFKDIVDSSSKSMKEINESVAQYSETMFNGVKENAEPVLDSITSIQNSLIATMDSLIDKSNQVFIDLGKNGVLAFQSIIDKIIELKASLVDSINIHPIVMDLDKVEAFKQLISEIKEEIAQVKESIIITIILQGIETAISQIKGLIAELKNIPEKVETVITETHVTKYKTEGEGTTIKAHTGMKIPGFGGGDKVPALLENGEWVINKFAVRKFGDNFMSSINNMRLPKFAIGGKVGNNTVLNKSTNENNSIVNNWNLRIGTETYSPKKGRVLSIAEQLITEVRRVY